MDFRHDARRLRLNLLNDLHEGIHIGLIAPEDQDAKFGNRLDLHVAFEIRDHGGNPRARLRGLHREHLRAFGKWLRIHGRLLIRLGLSLSQRPFLFQVLIGLFGRRANWPARRFVSQLPWQRVSIAA